MDAKLSLLFVLIGAVVALSNLDDDTLARVRRFLRWRGFVPMRRRN